MTKRTKTLIAILILFLFLTLFYRWQLATSGYYLNRGDDNYNSKDYNQALKDYRYAAIVDGNRNIIYQAKIKRAEIFYASGMLGEAKKELLEAIKENKTGYEAYELLGDVNYAERKFNLAIDYYDQATQFNNNEEIKIRIKIKKGKSLIAQNKMDLAEEIFVKLYLKNDSDRIGSANNNEVLYYLALFYFDKIYKSPESSAEKLYIAGELPMGEEIFLSNPFQEIEKSDDEVLKNKIRKIRNFISEYDENKNGDYKQVKIADLYNKINEPYLALNKINIVFENNQNYRDAWIISGEANFIIGDYERAIDNFEKALVLDSHNSEIYFWLGSVSERMRDDLRSKEFFGKYELLK